VGCSGNTTKAQQEADEAFTTAAGEIIEMTVQLSPTVWVPAHYAPQIDALQRGAQMQEALKLVAVPEGAEGAPKIETPPALQLGQLWLETLVIHSPSPSTLLELFDQPLLTQQV
jgi:hypothetical protein